MSDINIGMVTRIEGDKATVKISNPESCRKCGARILCRSDASGTRNLSVKNSIHAQVGNKIAISESGNVLLKLACMHYGVPFLGFVSGIVISYLTGFSIPVIQPEIIFFVGGLLGLCAGGIISWLWTKSKAAKPFICFRISRIIS